MVDLYEIYLITDLTNNKKYVGQVVQHRGYKVRFNEHLSGVNHANTRLLSNAIKKHGKDNFLVELVESNIPETLIDEKEMYYIEKYNTYYINNQGYNMTIGGQGIHGYKHSDTTRRKIAESSKNQWKKLKSNPQLLLERNNKISEKLKGKPKSEEAKKHLSVAAKNRFLDKPGTFKGKKHSLATKLKIADKNGHPVGMYDDNDTLLKTFRSATEASRYLIENNLTTNKSSVTRIIIICNGVKGQGKHAYGFKWKYLNEGVSTIPAGSRADNATVRSALSNDDGE